METKLEGLGLVIKGHCLLSELTPLYKSLSEMLNSDRNSIIMDLSKVETIDTAGLQLLLACRKSALENGKTFQLNPVSTSVKNSSNSSIPTLIFDLFKDICKGWNSGLRQNKKEFWNLFDPFTICKKIIKILKHKYVFFIDETFSFYKKYN